MEINVEQDLTKSLITLFQKLNEFFPPGNRRHHITLDDSTNLLEIGVWFNGENLMFTLDKNDLNDINQLLSDIKSLISEEE